ncbi:TniB family NTP-binding protein [Deinococcus aerophilus]|uniref:AAA+ ATPase domain-containing protein n=1 Tax=Deinococcus aerophilus TaxID=522488 RepID=A0ABQ2GZY6_9DEIO|nr:TniB family NTP-binding protein [Deinococcus aerophilus]GGM22299.1 hypothetical protein GCM10010841_32720 [Deinococcus aerophilus]
MLPTPVEPPDHETRAGRDAAFNAFLKRDTVIKARREQLWLPLENPERIITYLAHLATSPAQHRTMAPYLSVPANSGKTRLIHRALKRIVEETPPPREEAEFVEDADFTGAAGTRGGDIQRAILIDINGAKNSLQVATRLLEAIGNMQHTGSAGERQGRFVKFASKLQVRIIFMDEFQEMLGTPGRAEDLLELVKGLMLKGFMVIPVGTERVQEALKRNPHLATRYTTALSLPPLTPIEVQKTMEALARGFSGETACIFAPPNQNTVRATLELSRGLLGDVLNLTQHALVDHAELSVESIEKAAETLNLIRAPKKDASKEE